MADRRPVPRYGTALGLDHEWSQPLIVSCEFKTEIIVSRSGFEQRISIRDVPRYSAIVNLSDWGSSFLRFRNELLADQNAILYVALPWRTGAVSQLALSGQPEIRVEAPAPFWWAPRAYAVVGRGSRELVRVQSISGPVTTLAEDLTVDVPPSRFVSAWIGRLSSSLNLSAPTPMVGQGRVQIDMEPGFVFDPFVSLSGSDEGGRTYRGLPVLLTPPNRAETVQYTFERERDVVDLGFGRVSTFSPLDFATLGVRVLFSFLSVDAAERFWTFFRLCYGRRKPFWVPSYFIDFKEVRSAPVGFNAVSPASDLLAGSRTLKFVVARWIDGHHQFNEVTQISPQPDGSFDFTCAEAWSRPIGSARTLQWLQLVRFGSDQLTFDWLTPKVARAVVTFRSLPLMEAGVSFDD